MARRGLTLTLCISGFFIAGAAILAWHYVAGHRATADSQMQAPPVRVHVITPQAGGPERKLTRPGTIHAFEYADLFAKEMGYLRNQVVDIGDVVKKDQHLAEIYAPEITANVEKAVADLAKAQAQVNVMDARQAAAEADLEEARVKVEQTKSDLETSTAMLSLRKQQFNRFKELVEAKSIQQELLDEKFEARKAAEASEYSTRMSISSARSAVVSSEARVKAAEADVVDAKAQVQVCQASLDRARVFLAYTTIRAPFDGVITRRTFHDGDFILESSSNGNRPLLSIAATHKMRVIVDVPAPDIPYTRRGIRGDVSVDTLPGKVFKGDVARTSMLQDYTSQTMRTEIDLQNPDDLLMNGMFCSVTLYLGSNTHTLSIPSSCLIGKEHEGERMAYVVKEGKAHRTKVKVGIEDGITTEIVSGLDIHDQVVNGRGPGLTDGVPVVVDTGNKDARETKSGSKKESQNESRKD